jgi:hypothetical protein
MVRVIAVAGGLAVLMSLASTPATVEPAATDGARQVLFVSGIKDDAGKWKTQPGDTVLYLPGRSFYGWVAEMTSDDPVVVREVLVLPARAKQWPPEATVSMDGRTGTVVRTVRPNEGQIVGAWTVADGDPIGDYTLTVSIANDAYTFPFRVILPGQTGGGSRSSGERTGPMHILTKRDQLEGINTACLEAGWGWNAEYGMLSRDELLAQIDSLIARHENRVAHFQRCLERLGPLAAEVAGLTRSAAQRVRGNRIAAREPKVVALVDLATKVSERYAGTVTDVYPQLLAIERGYVQYFRSMKVTGARDVKDTLSQPRYLEDLEARVIARIRQDATRVADEAELYHAIAPSVTTGARVRHARIQAALYTALDTFSQADARTDLRRIRELRQEIKLIMFMVFQAASNPETKGAVPAVSARYQAVLEDLKGWDGTLALFEEAYGLDMSSLPSTKQDALAQLINEKTIELERSGDRVDRELVFIDRMLRAAVYDRLAR